MRTNKSFGHRRLAPTFWLVLHCCVIFACGESANPRSFPSSAFASISPEVASDCQRDAWAYLTALQNEDPWALAMFSSSTSVEGAIQSFSIYSMGDFDRCLQVEAPESLGAFHGEYCMNTIVASLIGRNITSVTLESDHHASSVRASKAATDKVQLSWAFCMPSTCSASDVTTLLNLVLKYTMAPKNISTTVLSSQCSKSEEFSMTAAEIAMV
ncbi:hypothetical protein J437_LFUL018822 [Ladona fulva]|uniref:Nose resistant-to-fluoxetine protein N-terminal domain-containing protein n=1 Tax=Ladona fulva TaxID=123851 RepID=A0A8K0PDC0_LADFU|nr:hypothetical protein J437_LFUL018822 [Ladona fulva]